MEKLIVIYGRQVTPAAAPAAVIALLNAHVAPHCHALTLHLRASPIPAEVIATGSFDETLDCALSLWVDRVDDLPRFESVLSDIGPEPSVYSVVESVPREYPRIDWRDGEASPGVSLVALMKRRPTVPKDEFFARWLAHTQISLRLHPLTRYHRNAVLRKVSGSGDDWDGIVEERVGDIADLDHARFYPDEASIQYTVNDLLYFVDLPAGGMRCGLTHEYILKRPQWL